MRPVYQLSCARQRITEIPARKAAIRRLIAAIMRRMSSHPIKTTSQRLQGLLKQGLAALAQGRAEAAS
nr:hypothetical protein [Xanthomonadales bacterium]NIX12115.1 hypothetical protein [Xanthomonadales bacterium]